MCHASALRSMPTPDWPDRPGASMTNPIVGQASLPVSAVNDRNPIDIGRPNNMEETPANLQAADDVDPRSAVDAAVVDRDAAIEALDASARKCTACRLSAGRSNVVFGVGNPNSPLMVVGEGPGMNEDASGVPFVGRAGELLDEALREAGMLRKHVYITNVLTCRACEQVDGRIQNRPPTFEELDACVPTWLHKQIAIIQPAVIVCVGAPSANTIIRAGFKIMSDRGKWFESKYARYA